MKRGGLLWRHLDKNLLDSYLWMVETVFSLSFPFYNSAIQAETVALRPQHTAAKVWYLSKISKTSYNISKQTTEKVNKKPKLIKNTFDKKGVLPQCVPLTQRIVKWSKGLLAHLLNRTEIKVGFCPKLIPFASLIVHI